VSARLRSRTLDRAAGVLLGGAAGDALGVPYEYGSRAQPGPGEHARMLGGGLGGFPPGGWSDDTAMACAVLEVAAQGADLRSEAALDRVAAGFRRWYDSGPTDVGVQTRRVLGGVGTPGAAPMRAMAAELHARTGRTAGTDTVAAIAGALLGAKYGGSAVPARWRRMLHGWPGLRAADLTRLAVLAVRGGRTDPEGWPLAATLPSYRGARTGTVAHPDDPGVLLGAVGSRRPGVADAVVSLCRLGAA